MRSPDQFRRTLFLGSIMLCAITLSAQDGYLTDLFIPRFIEAGQDHPLTMRARNAGGPSYTFFQVHWRVDGGTIHTMNQPVGGGGIIGNNSSYLEVTHPVPVNVAEGPHVLKVWIDVPDDPEPSNDTLTFNFTALNEWAPKVVLMEARTETWCPQCPPANTVTDQLLWDPSMAVVKFHLTDGWEFPDAVEYYDQYDADFTPAGVLELGEYTNYGSNADLNSWTAQMTARAQGVSPVHVTMDSDLDQVTRELTVTITANFTYAMDGPFKFNVYLAEDHVPGPQENAAPNYIHHGVMRALLGGAEGTSGVIPNSPVPGTGYSHTYSYTVPQELVLDHLYLVGVVEHAPGGNSRYALNSISSLHAPVSISEIAGHERPVSIHPNPFLDLFNVYLPGMKGDLHAEFFTVDGRAVGIPQRIISTDGRFTLSADDLPPGSYLLRVSDQDRSMTMRVVREAAR